MTYRIDHNTIQYRDTDTLEQALNLLRTDYPALVYHTDTERTLVWATEAESDNDAGAQAIADIRRVLPD